VLCLHVACLDEFTEVSQANWDKKTYEGHSVAVVSGTNIDQITPRESARNHRLKAHMRYHMAVKVYNAKVLSNNSMLTLLFDDVHRSIFLEYPAQVYNAVVILLRAGPTINMCPSFAVNLTAQNGVLTSPNYPNNYYNSANCQWRVIAQSPSMVSS
jgi:CUB domain